MAGQIFNKIIPWYPGLSLGAGIFNVPYIPRATVIDFDGDRTTTNNPQMNIELTFTSVTTSQQINEALGIDISLQIHTHFWGDYDARVAINQSSEFSKYCNYILAKVDIEIGWQTIQNPRFKPEFERRITNPHTDLEALRRTIGDGKVDSIKHGGRLIILIKAETETEDIQKDIEVETSADWLNIVDTDVAVEHTFEVLNKANRISIHASQIGGGLPHHSQLVLEPSEVANKLKSFPSEVIDAPVPFAVQISDYNSVPTTEPANFMDIQHAQQVIDFCGKLYIQLMNIRNDILYITSHREQFVDVDSSRYNYSQMLSRINQDLDKIKNAASTCHNDIPSCQNPVNIEVNYNLPKRKRSITPEGGSGIHGPAVLRPLQPTEPRSNPETVLNIGNNNANLSNNVEVITTAQTRLARARGIQALRILGTSIGEIERNMR